MPPIIAWTIGAIGATLLARTIVREWRRANGDLERMRTVPINKRDRERLPKLKRDPKSGVYRP